MDDISVSHEGQSPSQLRLRAGAAYASRTDRPEPRVGTVVLGLSALAGAAVVGAGLLLAAQRPTLLPGLSVPQTLAALGAITMAYLLWQRDARHADGVLATASTGYLMAGLLLTLPLLSASGGPAGELFGLAPGAAAVIQLAAYAAVPVFVLAALFSSRVRSPRWVLAGAAAAVAVAALAGAPSGLATADGRLTDLYAVLSVVLAGTAALAAALWGLRAGRRPTWPQLWVTVSLLLLAGAGIAGAGAVELSDPAWGAGVTLAAVATALPAAGLLHGLSRLARLLDRHERALVERLNEELRLATEGHELSWSDRLAREAAFERIAGVLTNGGPQMVFQPIWELRTGRVVGMEALARFPGSDHPVHAWFDEASSLGLGLQLELAAVEAALAELHSLPEDAFLAINVSPATVVSGRLVSLLQSAPAERIVLEVTEHAEVDDYQRLGEAIQQLTSLGVRLAVDDAGAGFASLRHIVRMAPALIKLDISLTRDIDVDPIRRSLASSLVMFSTDNGSTLVAEGIESQAELEALTELGVTCGQGFYLAEPAPLAKIAG